MHLARLLPALALVGCAATSGGPEAADAGTNDGPDGSSPVDAGADAAPSDATIDAAGPTIDAAGPTIDAAGPTIDAAPIDAGPPPAPNRFYFTGKSSIYASSLYGFDPETLETWFIAKNTYDLTDVQWQTLDVALRPDGKLYGQLDQPWIVQVDPETGYAWRFVGYSAPTPATSLLFLPVGVLEPGVASLLVAGPQGTIHLAKEGYTSMPITTVDGQLADMAYVPGRGLYALVRPPVVTYTSLVLVDLHGGEPTVIVEDLGIWYLTGLVWTGKDLLFYDYMGQTMAIELDSLAVSPRGYLGVPNTELAAGATGMGVP